MRRAVAAAAASAGNFDDSDDPYDQAVAIVLRDGKASTSYIQRRLGIGYNRAASIIERMEKEGIVGPANHAGKREILVPTEDDKFWSLAPKRAHSRPPAAKLDSYGTNGPLNVDSATRHFQRWSPPPALMKMVSYDPRSTLPGSALRSARRRMDAPGDG